MSDVIFRLKHHTRLRELIEFMSTYPFTLGDLEMNGIVDYDIELRSTSNGIYLGFERDDESPEYNDFVQYMHSEYVIPDNTDTSLPHEGSGRFLTDMFNILDKVTSRVENTWPTEKRRKNILKWLAAHWEIKISFDEDKKTKAKK